MVVPLLLSRRDLFDIVTRPMNSNPNHQVTRRPWGYRVVLVVSALILCSTSIGCEEISARREIQEGNKQFERGKYEEAVTLFEQALTKAPHLDTAHYNAALAYKKLFRPGVETPENLGYAESSAKHFNAYLANNPTDREIVTVLTRLWNDAGDYDSALQYWERELAKEPNNTEIIGILAGTNRQAQRWDKAIEWNMRQVEIEKEPAAKASAYKAVAGLMVSRLRGRQHQLIGEERLQLADTGIAALQKAAALTPDDPDVQTALGFLYGERSLGQMSTWAQIVEIAAARHHYKRWSALNKAAKAQTGGAAPEAEATTPESDDDASGDEASGDEAEADAPGDER